MAPVVENLPRPTNALDGVEHWARRHTRQWCMLCDEFKEETRQTMLARQPSDSELERHRRALRMFLRMTRLLYAEAADPDFLDRSLAAELAIRLRQLED